MKKYVIIHSFLVGHILEWRIKYIGEFNFNKSTYDNYDIINTDIIHSIYAANYNDNLWIRIFEYNDFIKLLQNYSAIGKDVIFILDKDDIKDEYIKFLLNLLTI